MWPARYQYAQAGVFLKICKVTQFMPGSPPVNYAVGKDVILFAVKRQQKGWQFYESSSAVRRRILLADESCTRQ